MLVQVAVEEGVEHELRVPLVVTHLSLIGQAFTFLRQVQTEGVNPRTVIDERVEMTLAVDASDGRCIEVNEQFLEGDVAGLQEVGKGIVALALDMQFHRGQQPFDGGLVYDLLIELGHDRVAEYGYLSEYCLIAFAGIEFHDEVAALDACVGGVPVGLDVQSEVVGTVDMFLVGDIKFT